MLRSLARPGLPLLALTLCAGCGHSHPDDPIDAAITDGSPATRDLAHAPPDLQFAVAPHPPFPQVIQHAGAVLAHPQVVTVTFAGYAYAKTAGDFADAIVGSDWLKQAGAEYGVGAGVSLKKVVLPALPSLHLTDDMITALVGQHIDDGMLPSPRAVKEIVYLLYFPSNVTIDDGSGAQSCGDWAGYHSSASHLARYAYAIIPDCKMGEGYTIDTASHELIEAATDPYLDGWFLDVDPTDLWFSHQEDEVADLCGDNPPVMANGFAVERVWSNAAALAGASPCVPIPADEVYQNVGAKPASTQLAAAGSSVTFALTGWSTAPGPDWELRVEAADPAVVDFDPTGTLSTTHVNNGTTVMLTLHVPPGTPSGKIGGVDVYSGSGYGMFWPVTVEAK